VVAVSSPVLPSLVESDAALVEPAVLPDVALEALVVLADGSVVASLEPDAVSDAGSPDVELAEVGPVLAPSVPPEPSLEPVWPEPVTSKPQPTANATASELT
jgi:hypothetical protein